MTIPATRYTNLIVILINWQGFGFGCSDADPTQCAWFTHIVWWSGPVHRYRPYCRTFTGA